MCVKHDFDSHFHPMFMYVPTADCIEHYSIPDGGTDQTSPGYDIGNTANLNAALNAYVGPWSTADSRTITLKVTPQPMSVTTSAAGDGQNLGIFLSTEPDITSATAKYYGIRKWKAPLTDWILGQDI